MTGRLPVDPRLSDTGVVAILRGGDGAHLVPVADALVEAGIRCIEITTNTSGAAAGLAELLERHGATTSFGLGTVRSVTDVETAAELGVSFVVAPDTDREVGGAAADHGLGWYPGAFTPTEIARAWSLGATAVKVFPAEFAGGPAYVSAVRAPLDDVLLLPTGGVAVDAVGAYLRAGAVAVGLGSPLIGAALRTGDVDEITARARTALDAVAQSREVRDG